jgi:hypothetical protein
MKRNGKENLKRKIGKSEELKRESPRSYPGIGAIRVYPVVSAESVLLDPCHGFSVRITPIMTSPTILRLCALSLSIVSSVVCQNELFGP